MKRLLLITLAVLALGTPAKGYADIRSAEATLSFADQLFAERDYFRAITEYERFIFHFPDHGQAAYAQYQIALSYYMGDRLDDAIRLFEKFADKHPADEQGRQALLRIAEAYFQKKDYTQAIACYERFLRNHPDAPEADATRIQIGWSYLRQGDWRRAAMQYDSIPVSSPLREQALWLSTEAKTYPAVPSKSPALAGGLSAVLPGAGQLYVGRKYDALLSFMMNGVFIWATAEALHNHSHTTAGVLLFFETGWYFGNVYSAVSSAHKYNRDRQQGYLERLSNQYGFSLLLDNDRTAALAFTMRF
ncbi:MAG: tetratricopeptide repeat protein [Nitrospirota bacterium]|nr:tetratricopeptide repeat protein [Nitrospirota bacterium]